MTSISYTNYEEDLKWKSCEREQDGWRSNGSPLSHQTCLLILLNPVLCRLWQYLLADSYTVAVTAGRTEAHRTSEDDQLTLPLLNDDIVCHGIANSFVVLFARLALVPSLIIERR